MNNDVFDPFNEDVAEIGGYEYTAKAGKSSEYSNNKNTQIILANIDFEGKRVLDIGCGDGTFTYSIRKNTKAAYITGIDPAKNAIEHASKKYMDIKDIEFKNMMLNDLVESGEKYDVAVFRGVLHHVGSPQKEIALAFKVADEIMIIEPNGLNFVLKLLERFSSYHRKHKERSYKMSSLCRWIESGGGKVCKKKYHGLVPFFSPDVFVTVGSRLEPIVESIPFIRSFVCGRMAIAATKKND